MPSSVPASILEEELRLQKARVSDRDDVIRGLTRRLYGLEAELEELRALQLERAGPSGGSEGGSTLPESRRRDAATFTGSDWVIWHETAAMLQTAELEFRARILQERAEWFGLAVAQRWAVESSGLVLRQLHGVASGALEALRAAPPVFMFAGPSQPSRPNESSPVGPTDVYFVGTGAELRASASPIAMPSSGSRMQQQRLSSPQSPGGGLPEGSEAATPGGRHGLPPPLHTFRTTMLVAPYGRVASSAAAGPASPPSLAQEPTGGSSSAGRRLVFPPSAPRTNAAPAASGPPFAQLLGHFGHSTALLQHGLDGLVATLHTNASALCHRIHAVAQTAVGYATDRSRLQVEEAYQRHSLDALAHDEALTLLRTVVHGTELRMLGSHIQQLLKENAAMLDFGMQEACQAHVARSNAEAVTAAARQTTFHANMVAIGASEYGERARGIAAEESTWSTLVGTHVRLAATIQMEAQRLQFQHILRSNEVSLRQDAEPHQRQLLRACEDETYATLLVQHGYFVAASARFKRHQEARAREMYVQYAIGSVQEVVHPLLLAMARSVWDFLRFDVLPALASMQGVTAQRVRHAMRLRTDIALECMDERLALTQEQTEGVLRLVVTRHKEQRLVELAGQRGHEAAFVLHHACIAAADALEQTKRSTSELYGTMLADWGRFHLTLVAQQRTFHRHVLLQQRARGAVIDQERTGRRFLEVWEAEHAYERILMPMHAAAVTHHIRAENDVLIQSIETDTVAIVRDVTLREQRLLAVFGDTSLIPLHRHASRMLLELHADVASMLAEFLRNDVTLSERRWKHRASADANRQIASASSAVSQTLEKAYEGSLVLFVNLRDELEAGYRQRVGIVTRVAQDRLASFASRAMTEFLSHRQVAFLEANAECWRARDAVLVARSHDTLRQVLTRGVVDRVQAMQQHEALYCGNLVREALLLARRMADECHHSTFQHLALQQQLTHLRRTGPLAERDALRNALHASEGYIAIAEGQKPLLARQATLQQELERQEQHDFAAMLLAFTRGLVAFARGDRLMRDALTAAGGSSSNSSSRSVNMRQAAHALAGHAGAAVEWTLLATTTAPSRCPRSSVTADDAGAADQRSSANAVFGQLNSPRSSSSHSSVPLGSGLPPSRWSAVGMRADSAGFTASPPIGSGTAADAAQKPRGAGPRLLVAPSRDSPELSAAASASAASGSARGRRLSYDVDRPASPLADGQSRDDVQRRLHALFDSQSPTGGSASPTTAAQRLEALFHSPSSYQQAEGSAGTAGASAVPPTSRFMSRLEPFDENDAALYGTPSPGRFSP